MYSTITKRKCKCSENCNKWPSAGCQGYAYAHLPEDLKEKIGTKRQLQIKNRNKRTALSRKLHIAQKEAQGDTQMSKLWFASKRHEMTGICLCGCGNPSSKESDRYFKFSICHILPQRHFKSVQWHPLNWVEMAFWGGCHTNMDDKGSDNWPNLKCWPLIVERFKILYPLTLPEEHQFIPQILLDTL